MGFRVQGVGFRVWGLGFRVQGVGFRVWGFGFRVSGLGFRVSVLGCRASGLGFNRWVWHNTLNFTELELKMKSKVAGQRGAGFRQYR